VKACHGAAGDFKLEYKRTINPRDVMVDVKEEYDNLGDLLQKLQNDRGAKHRFKEIQKQVKQKLLGQLRKQSSAYGPEGGDVEGLVFRDLESGQMVKLVDQDYFRALNEFMWSWRNRLNKDVLGGFSQTVAKNVLGDVGAASNRLVTNILAAGEVKSGLEPAVKADILIANYIIKNNLMKSGFLENFSEALNGVAGDLEKLEAEWSGVLGSEITQNIAGKLRVMGPEVKGRTQESINDAKATLAGIRAGVEAAQNISDPLTQKVAIFKLFMGHKFDRLVDKLGSDTSFSNENTVSEGGPIDRMTGPTDMSGASRIDGQVPDGEEVNEAPKWLKGITAATMMGLAAPTAIDNTEPPPPKPQVEPAKPNREELIKNAQLKYQLPEYLLPAMIHIESSGRSHVVSKKGAAGLMQINPVTQQHLGVTDPHDEAQSIEGGAKYMRQLLDRFNGKLDRALAAYNAGPTFVAKAKPERYPLETKKYIKKVKHQMRKLAHAKKPVESVVRETFSRLLEEAGDEYIGATIGRYQPFHAGHAAIIRQLAQKYTRVLVFVAGLKGDAQNPFSYDLRLELMEKSLPDVWSKIRVYPASIQNKGTGYIPGLIANVSQANELNPKQPVTVLVGADRLAAVKQQVEHNNKHMGEPGYYTGTIEVEMLPNVKNDDDAERISGTRLRAAIANGDRKEIKRMFDAHLVSDPAAFEEILVKMAKDLKGKPKVSVESIVEEVIAELGMGAMETGAGFTKGGAWGSSGWSRAILAGDEDGDEMFQQMLKSPSTRMLPMANHGTPNSDLPGINRVEAEPNNDELREPTDLDEVILRVLRRHSVVR
jgi:cytidyltransferase-like protein